MTTIVYNKGKSMKLYIELEAEVDYHFEPATQDECGYTRPDITIKTVSIPINGDKSVMVDIKKSLSEDQLDMIWSHAMLENIKAPEGM